MIRFNRQVMGMLMGAFGLVLVSATFAEEPVYSVDG